MDNFLFEKLQDYKERIAIWQNHHSYSYADLLEQISKYHQLLDSIPAHSKVAIQSDYSLESIALFLALLKNQHTIIPIISPQELDQKLQESYAEFLIAQSDMEKIIHISQPKQNLFELNDAGLILFSSGSTGKPKAMLHNLSHILKKFENKKSKQLSMLLFLMFDHIGGINTLLNILSTGQTAIIPNDRKDVHHIANLIETHKISILPTSPTFLNLMLLNKVHLHHNLSSLKMISYGTESMPETLLKKLQNAFPKTKFLQTFGTSEVGIMQTISEKSGSLFMKISDPNIEYKIVNQELWIKSQTQVLGYLNASMENFVDGYFKTGDLVETKMINGEEYIRIIGRNKEMINVGGEKVLPQEIESIILQIDGILDCLVYGEKNAITGQSICCEVVIDSKKIKKDEIKKMIRSFCKGKIDNYKIPSKVLVKEELQASERFKKVRNIAKQS
ncbi:hypothetical protein BBW65_03950 [Helicobacter enhydrae]|uniref:AMP-dependent synthetase n=1 Tax=Helicobacter enhydrae TaxID=222136 RepID=A0A1B1U5D1_9HELI|nr:class I adenylate-forming enzyme family protein [Helicobacter enhydrae]ANV98004.1 hypothetical protein BBW65_03950 [Helicobacter enhydrae]